MSETYNIPRDSTLQEMVEMDKQRNAYLAVIAAGSMEGVISDYASIKRIVQDGLAPQVFNVGDQINAKWNNPEDNVDYTYPFDVVDFGNVELQNGEVVPGMFLQGHYAQPIAMPFDAREAFYYAADGLKAGTYYFTFGYTWGEITNGDMYEFTLEEDVPAGAQLYFNSNLYSASGDGTKVNVYASADSTTTIQTATLSKVTSSSGTNLGNMTRAFNGNLGSEQSALYGHNRWATSAYRQWLNSAEAAGEWWEPQSDFDRAPTELNTYPGFLSGFEQDFLDIITPVKMVTVPNTVDGIGVTDETYDKFFMASLEQMFIVPQTAGVEGDAWEYWKRVTGSAEAISRTNAAGTFPLTYDLADPTTARYVRLRSAYQSYACGTWYVSSTGAVNGNGATSACRCAPACVIC